MDDLWLTQALECLELVFSCPHLHNFADFLQVCTQKCSPSNARSFLGSFINTPSYSTASKLLFKLEAGGGTSWFYVLSVSALMDCVGATQSTGELSRVQKSECIARPKAFARSCSHKFRRSICLAGCLTTHLTIS